MDSQMDYIDGLPNKLPLKKERKKYYPFAIRFDQFTPDPPSCCFHFVFITAAQMVAGAVVHHDA